LTLQTSENGYEWNDGSEMPSTAAYIRLINETEEEITATLSEFRVLVQSFTEPEVSHNYDGIYSGNIDNLLNGDYGGKVHFASGQENGKYVELDLGGAIDLDTLRFVINDGEGDYFREGDVQVSIDRENWDTIHTFDAPDTREENFPEHVAPYRYKTIEGINQQARYILLISSAPEGTPKWLALNTIIVNDGQALAGPEDLTIHAKDTGAKGKELYRIKDRKLGTFYSPESNQAGELTYKIHENTKVEEIIVLQGPDVISEATVSIRTENGWTDIGQLSTSFNRFAIDADHVLTVKITWGDGIQPELHELVVVEGLDEDVDEPIDITTLENMIATAKELLTDETLYTEETYEKLVQALDYAESELNAIETEEQLQVVIDELQKAIDQLEEKEEVEDVDKNDLSDLVSQANDLLEADYTEETWQAFLRVKEEAEAILANEDAT